MVYKNSLNYFFFLKKKYGHRQKFEKSEKNKPSGFEKIEKCENVTKKIQFL